MGRRFNVVAGVADRGKRGEEEGKRGKRKERGFF